MNYQKLIERTQRACNDLGIDVEIKIVHDHYDNTDHLSGTYTLPVLFENSVHRIKSEWSEEIYLGDQDGTFNLFMRYFNPSRVAYMNAEDADIIKFGGHPDRFLSDHLLQKV